MCGVGNYERSGAAATNLFIAVFGKWQVAQKEPTGV